jgi:hypothetical protein
LQVELLVGLRAAVNSSAASTLVVPWAKALVVLELGRTGGQSITA